MRDVLHNVTATAVWGSLAATVFLGAFMWVQAVSDRQRRVRFAVFASVCCAIATADFLYQALGPTAYELIRLTLWSWYVAAVLLLFAYPLATVLATALGLPLLGMLVWVSGRPELATTVVFPIGFAIAAFAHGRHFLSTRGFGSCILATYSAAMSLFCSIFYLAGHAVDPRVVPLGYAHWALLTASAVLFGWTHFPRELRGQAPVRIQLSHALLVGGAVILAEVGVILGMLVFFRWPPEAYLVSSILVVAPTLLLHFHHRHRLVIHTDNVSALLEERTADLREAQGQLSRQNDVLAQRLEEQARELKAKGEVIGRQRRVELAAQVAGETAHDIQNLLSPIQTYLDQLEEDPSRGGAVHDTTARIRRQVEQLLELNAQLLALSRRGRVEAQPVDLGDVVSSVIERFPGQPVVVERGAPAWVQGSWAQVSRAVSNLITNALDVEPRRRPVVVVRSGLLRTTATQRCHLGFLPAGEFAYVQVEDSGPGIPEAIRERIFEPFFSSKSGPHRSGTGLGLSIVAGVVDDHQGVLDLETGPEGTRFTMYFPSIPAPDGVPRAEDLYGNETVVVAEDDRVTQSQCVRFLEEAGYSVIPADDGEEVLRILQVESVDLLLMDLQMPRLGGAEALFAAIHMRPGVRVVVHTSYVTAEDSARLLSLGASEILLKPASRQEILRAARRALAPHPARAK